VNKPSLSVPIAIILGISLISVGVTAMVAPQFASTMFGIAAADPSAWAYVKATGLRDIVIGCSLIALTALRAGTRILGMTLMILVLIPIGDATIVMMNAGVRSVFALALHIVGAVVYLAVGFWLSRPKEVQANGRE
jgi:hypothetical protein